MLDINDLMNQIICGDALEVMRGMPDKSIDLCVTDFPYGIDGGRGGTSKERGKGEYGKLYFEDTREYVRTVCLQVLQECRRIAMGVILTPGSKNLDLYPQADSFGCFYQPAAVGLQHWGMMDAQPILYYGRYDLAGIMPMPCSYQLTEKPSCDYHPCSKPINAWKKLVNRCPVDGIVLDPMCGVGTTAVAAKQLGRKFIGIEISEEYCAIARQRLAQEELF